MNIDTFLKQWLKKSTKLDTSERREYHNLEVQLSKSGHYNTLRVNALKSKDPKKGHATKFMKSLIKEANKNKFDIELCAQPWGHSFEDVPTKDVVREWLLKLGFKIKFEYPDKEGYEMVYKHK